VLDFVDHPVALVVVSVLSFPVYVELGRMFFGNAGGFVEAVRYLFTPDFWSALRGRFYDDFWAELKLGVYLLLCAGWTTAMYKLCLRALY
jgi:hypothetical protein